MQLNPRSCKPHTAGPISGAPCWAEQSSSTQQVRELHNLAAGYNPHTAGRTSGAPCWAEQSSSTQSQLPRSSAVCASWNSLTRAETPPRASKPVLETLPGGSQLGPSRLSSASLNHSITHSQHGLAVSLACWNCMPGRVSAVIWPCAIWGVLHVLYRVGGSWSPFLLSSPCEARVQLLELSKVWISSAILLPFLL